MKYIKAQKPYRWVEYSQCQERVRFVANRLKRERGQQIAEFGPALFLLVVVFFFPLVDAIYLGLAYGTGWYLNQLETRAVTVNNPPDATAAAGSQKDNILSSGIAQFVGLQEVSCTVKQIANAADPAVVETSVVTSVVTAKPLITIQLPFAPSIQVPGLGGPVTFTYTTSQLQEERAIN